MIACFSRVADSLVKHVETNCTYAHLVVRRQGLVRNLDSRWSDLLSSIWVGKVQASRSNQGGSVEWLAKLAWEEVCWPQLYAFPNAWLREAADFIHTYLIESCAILRSSGVTVNMLCRASREDPSAQSRACKHQPVASIATS